MMRSHETINGNFWIELIQWNERPLSKIFHYLKESWLNWLNQLTLVILIIPHCGLSNNQDPLRIMANHSKRGIKPKQKVTGQINFSYQNTQIAVYLIKAYKNICHLKRSIKQASSTFALVSC